MINNEFYYLVLVVAAFGAFGLAMVIATLQYRAWKKQPLATTAALSSATAQRKEMARAA